MSRRIRAARKDDEGKIGFGLVTMRTYRHMLVLMTISAWIVGLRGTPAGAECTDPHPSWPTWQASFEILTPQNDRVTTLGLAVAPSGEVFVAGHFYGRVDFNPSSAGVDVRTSFTPQIEWPWNRWDAFLTRLEPDGSYGWTYVDGFDFGDAIMAVTVDPPDAIDPETYILIAGYFEIFLFAGPLGPSEGRDAFVAKFPIDGFGGFEPTAVWARSFGDDNLGDRKSVV